MYNKYCEQIIVNLESSEFPLLINVLKSSWHVPLDMNNLSIYLLPALN